MKKRILAFIVFLTVLCTAFPTFAENTVTGSCGKDLTWIYNYSEKTLTISGRGNMSNYYSNSRAGSLAPWVNSTNIKNDLETVVISEGVTSIGEYAFFECTSLKNIVLSGSVKTINMGAFYQCAALPGITIPNSVTTIGNGAFSSCHISAEESESGIESGLEKVTIQDGVEAIGKFAFNGCKKLKDVTLPDSIKSIGDNAFQQTGLYNDDTTWEELYIGNHLIKVDEWALNQGGTNDYRIDPGTKTIADHAFDGCISLTSITIPNSVRIIGKEAFEGCPRKIKVNYIGSTTDWNEVIGDGKYVLANVGINYISGISTKHSDDGKIVVKLINIDTGKTVIMALYDGDKLAEMQLSSEYSETNREITFTPTKDYTRAKVMVWESLASMSSVCESKIVK